MSEYSSRQDVLGLALDLHMHATGSHPDLSPENRAFAVRFLRTRLAHWSRNHGSSEVFDTAVRLVLVAALAEDQARSEHEAQAL